MSSSDLSANMRATSEAFIMGFDGDWSPGATAAQRAPDCEHTIIPASLGIPKRNNEQWLEYFKTVAPLVRQAKMSINDYLAVPDEHRAVARSSMTATTPVGPYSCEYVWFLTFNEAGDQIVNITEFIDTKSAGDILSKFKEAGLR